ncbi:hypothetical protein [Tychonema sp. LEGE 07203]|uniref:hypothetical protein n=1 Tax=Tychonema sp. LEGE 07203 TaxID=1828671 RepID=UPI001A0BF7A0|nr:hypothetical protein [Tychonema sp. LEGE 07203]MBE9092969.1 hypothetical protein [Tychonema sp. LEGE 07203]
MLVVNWQQSTVNSQQSTVNSQQLTMPCLANALFGQSLRFAPPNAHYPLPLPNTNLWLLVIPLILSAISIGKK